MFAQVVLFLSVAVEHLYLPHHPILILFELKFAVAMGIMIHYHYWILVSLSQLSFPVVIDFVAQFGVIFQALRFLSLTAIMNQAIDIVIVIILVVVHVHFYVLDVDVVQTLLFSPYLFSVDLL